jgi:phage-related tail protein
MTDKELVERLLDFDKVTVGDARDAALRIEQLVATNEALTKERGEAMAMARKVSRTTIKYVAGKIAAEAKLEKAVRGLNAICVWGEDTYARDMARATLAEIEGETR